MLYIDQSVLKLMQFITVSDTDLNGIFVGRIQKNMSSTNSCFVEYQKNKVGYLSYKEAGEAFLCNRQYDGTLKQGDLILVKVVKEGIKTKLPTLTGNIANGFTEEELSLISHKSVFSILKNGEKSWINALNSRLSHEEYAEVITDIPEFVEELEQYHVTTDKKVRFYKDDKLSLASLYSLAFLARLTNTIFNSSPIAYPPTNTHKACLESSRTSTTTSGKSSTKYVASMPKSNTATIAIITPLTRLSLDTVFIFAGFTIV